MQEGIRRIISFVMFSAMSRGETRHVGWLAKFFFLFRAFRPSRACDRVQECSRHVPARGRRGLTLVTHSRGESHICLLRHTRTTSPLPEGCVLFVRVLPVIHAPRAQGR